MSCSQANVTAAALERTDWNLLDSLRNLSGRVDGIGTQATQVVARLAEDAASNDTTRRLRPALERAHADAVRLLTEASRVAVQPEPWKPDPTTSRISVLPPATMIRGRPTTPTSRPRARSPRPAVIWRLNCARFGDLAAQRPDTQITVNWTVVDEQ
ncbi:hypothetical protein HCB18_26940 [Salinispora arenicola]|uniref:hypothetical protein n=1 Tax=Salinispora arenicola TaxID=168697 RepID=UPI00169C0AF5|nr:hypothetical protein [Salinispora arenicola]NIL60009.1 hypothetical protein [Salinispora arenicola]